MGSIYSIVSVIILIVCILLILIVLVQNSKGGGLASNFSAANQVMGVRRSTDFLEKATWTFATILLGLCLIASVTIRRSEGSRSVLEDAEDNTVNFDQPMNLPLTLPESEDEQAQ